MRHAKQVFYSMGLCMILGCLPGSPAEADPDAGTVETEVPQSLPAVDGVNGKISGFGGAADGQTLFGGIGAVAWPVGHRYGLQIDALVASFDSDIQGDVTVAGAAAHFFWRDPSRGLIGAYGHYVHADVYRGVDIYAGGVEGALYSGRFTLEGIVGVEGGEVDTVSAGSFDVDTRFSDWIQVAYYPTDDVKLSATHVYVLGDHAAVLGAEWGLNSSARTMASLFALGTVFEEGDSSLMVGLSVYFGRRSNTLIRRHRENDPNSAVTYVATYINVDNFGAIQ